MIIAIDIGNTNTSMAIVGEGLKPSRTNGTVKIIQTETVKTGIRGCYEKRMTKALRTLLSDTRHKTQDTRKSEDRSAKSEKGKSKFKISYTATVTNTDTVIICSVVPKATVIAARCVNKVFKVTPKIIGKDIIVPIKNKYSNPDEVGQDRLLCAYAAIELYGKPAVVVDLGTAMTFDVVSSKKEYLGGMIVPGIRLSVEALYDKTALLPKIDIHKPKNLIGKTTEESMLSGLFYGYGEMIKGLIDLLSKQLKEKPQVIVTGGYSDLMKKYVPEYDCIVDKELIFKGMRLLKKER